MIGHSHKILVAYSSLVFFFLSLIVSVLPAFDMEKVAPLDGISPLGERSLEAYGRKLYLAEGCATCHTQFVRNLTVDKNYGRGSLAGDYALESPPMLGTQRTGPDLSNVGLRQPSEVWNLIHLYNPRAVVPNSVMPGYPWYFKLVSEDSSREDLVPIPKEFVPTGKAVLASREAKALAAYLRTLKQVEIK